MQLTTPRLLQAGLAILLGLGLASCTGQPPEQPRLSRPPVMSRPAPSPPAFTPNEDTPHSVETGLASWYGPGFEGRQTANGEIFDSSQLTAAHRTMRLPSRARVTRLDTGDSIIVRVNDRGPYIEGRLIDLSHAAAEALGFTHDGLVEVRVEGLGPADARDRAASPVFFNPEDGPPGSHTPSFTQNLDATLQPSSDEG